MRTPRVHLGLAAWIFLVFAPPVAQAAEVQVQVIARTGQAAPGVPEGARFSLVGPARLNDRGEVLFQGRLERGPGGVTDDDDSGFWWFRDAGFELMLRESSPLPGRPEITGFVTFFRLPELNDRGEVALKGTIRVPGPFPGSFLFADGIWGPDLDGALHPLALEGETAPGAPNGAPFDSINAIPALNALGQVAFAASFNASLAGVPFSDATGIWMTNSDGDLVLVLRNGVQVLGAPPGILFDLSTSLTPMMNGAGQLLFPGRVRGPGTTSQNDDALFGPGAEGEVTILAREDDLAPGIDTGAVFGTSFTAPRAMNDAGQIALTAGLRVGVGGVNSSNDWVLWRRSGAEGFELLMREGEIPPGFTSETLRLISLSHLDQDGGVIASGVVGSFVSGKGAIWHIGVDSEPELILVEGDPVGEAVPGAEFDDLFGPMLNDAGDAFFLARIRGAGVDSSNESAIFTRDRSGKIQLVVREGDEIEVEPGVFRRIIDAPRLIFGAGQELKSVNDQRQVLFTAFLDDGTNGIFLRELGPGASIVVVDIKPGSEPNSINLSSEGEIPVAIVGSSSFDIASVDTSTLSFGPDSASLAHSNGPHFEDTDGDGILDLLAHFRTEETGIEFGVLMACLRGNTLDGSAFSGCDSVRTVPDMDGDGLLDSEEAALSTNPLRVDTDRDGFGDAAEVHTLGTDPLDALDPQPSPAGEPTRRNRRRR